MENFVSSWSDGKKLPESYVFPLGKRPGDVVVTTSKNVPVIDIGKAEGADRSAIIQQIMQASQEFGFFQVFNHGVPRTLINDTTCIFKEFFALPAEKKRHLCSSDERKNCILLTSGVGYDKEEFHNWRDTLRLNCTPFDECKQDWTLEPPRFRDIVGEYITEIGKLGLRILELICEGLGLEKGYFTKEIIENELLVIHQYPPCPDPSLTLGTRSHYDPGLIAILLQEDVPGLQVMKDGEWNSVEVIPDAFVVNIGHILQIVSNGKLRSAEHRVVTNKDECRISAAFLFMPGNDCMVEPAEAIVNSGNSAIYKQFQFADFFKSFKAAYVGEIGDVLEKYMI